MLKSNEEWPELLTVADAAKYLRVHRSTVYRLLKDKSLPGAFRVGSDWRVRRDTLLDALRNGDLSYKTPKTGLRGSGSGNRS